MSVTKRGHIEENLLDDFESERFTCLQKHSPARKEPICWCEHCQQRSALRKAPQEEDREPATDTAERDWYAEIYAVGEPTSKDTTKKRQHH